MLNITNHEAHNDQNEKVFYTHLSAKLKKKKSDKPGLERMCSTEGVQIGASTLEKQLSIIVPC